jgi:hypothetical protein
LLHTIVEGFLNLFNFKQVTTLHKIEDKKIRAPNNKPIAATRFDRVTSGLTSGITSDMGPARFQLRHAASENL